MALHWVKNAFRKQKADLHKPPEQPQSNFESKKNQVIDIGQEILDSVNSSTQQKLDTVTRESIKNNEISSQNTVSGHRKRVSIEYEELKGNYILLELIGKGGFSKVYKAIDLKNEERLVAIKIMHKKSLNSTQLQALIKEASIMQRISHENIVRLYESIESESNFFLVLEYCAGGEIYTQLSKYTYFSEDLARHVIIQVALAVKYLHEKTGIAHRDIKPENLLFIPCEFIPRSKEEALKARRQSDGDSKVDEGKFIMGIGGGGIGLVKIADFGLSKILWNTTTQTPCGTTGYTAPEIVKQEKYDKSVDLWTMGCVLYTFLCGYPPFYDINNDTAKLLSMTSKGSFEFISPWWDEISDEAKALVRNLLNVNPTKRYTINQLLSDPWIVKGYKNKFVAHKIHHYSEKNIDYFPNFNEFINENVTKDEFGPTSTSGGVGKLSSLKEETRSSLTLSTGQKNSESDRSISTTIPILVTSSHKRSSSQSKSKQSYGESVESSVSVSYNIATFKKSTESFNNSNDPDFTISNLSESLSAVTFKPRTQQGIPRTPCPTKVNFSDESDESEDDQEDTEVEKSEGADAKFEMKKSGENSKYSDSEESLSDSSIQNDITITRKAKEKPLDVQDMSGTFGINPNSFNMSLDLSGSKIAERRMKSLKKKIN